MTDSDAQRKKLNSKASFFDCAEKNIDLCLSANSLNIVVFPILLRPYIVRNSKPLLLYIDSINANSAILPIKAPPSKYYS